MSEHNNNQAQQQAITVEAFEAELAAIQTIGKTLAALPSDARERVMRWASIYFRSRFEGY